MEEVINLARKFRTEREWEQFHTPENIAKSISIEAGELLQHFQWDNLYNKQDVADELADILIYCIYMADSLQFAGWMTIRSWLFQQLLSGAAKPADHFSGLWYFLS